MKKIFKVFLWCYFIFADFALTFKDMSFIPRQITIDVSSFLVLLKIFDLLIYILLGAFVLLVVSAVGCWVKNGFKLHFSLNKEKIANRLRTFFNFKKRPIKSALWIVQIAIGVCMIPFTITAICGVIEGLLA